MGDIDRYPKLVKNYVVQQLKADIFKHEATNNSIIRSKAENSRFEKNIPVEVATETHRLNLIQKDIKKQKIKYRWNKQFDTIDFIWHYSL